jgi:CheY-like chemotaxis protein
LIILDLEMPNINGFEAIPEIKKIQPNVKIIVCSGLTRFEFETIQKVLALGADGVTSKLFQKGISHELSMTNFRLELVPRIIQLYHNSKTENAHKIADHSYARNIIDGILVIHLLEKNRDLLTYDFGTVDNGLEEVNLLMEHAKNTNTPICFDFGFDTTTNKEFETIPELTLRFHNYPQELRDYFRETDYGQSLDWINPSMRSFINDNAVKNILVIGFNRTCCIKNSVEQIQKYYNVNAFTCEEYLFGNNTNKPFLNENPAVDSFLKPVDKISKKEVHEYLARNRFIKACRKKLLCG